MTNRPGQGRELRTSERDALPQAVDYLATLEGVETAIVFGIVDQVMSARLSAGLNLTTGTEPPATADGDDE